MLVFLVHSYSSYTSRFRIKYFMGENKLYQNMPIFESVLPGEYKYFWQVNIDGIPSLGRADWYHYYSTGLKTIGADVDMYISVFDGRMPTVSDHDFSSTRLGADVIKLDSQDPYFQKTNEEAYHPRDGLVVVVGVYNPGDITAMFTISNRSYNYFSAVTDVVTNESQSVDLAKNSGRNVVNSDRRVFKWYNWEHGDFTLQVRALSGKANFYLNFIGETDY